MRGGWGAGPLDAFSPRAATVPYPGRRCQPRLHLLGFAAQKPFPARAEKWAKKGRYH